MRCTALGKIKVLVLIPNLGIGGAEMDLVRTLPLVNRNRFEVVVCAVQGRGALAAPLSEAGIEVISPFPVEPSKPGLGHWAVRQAGGMACRLVRIFPRCGSILRLPRVGLTYIELSRPIRRVLDSGRFDIVHTMSPTSYLIGALATGFGRRQALVMSRVSLNFYQHRARLLGTIERLLHRRVTLAIGNARAILRELGAEGIPASKLHLIHNGINSADFIPSMIDRPQARERLGLAQADLVFTSVANLFPYKGHVDLLQALHMVRDRLPAEWVLLVSGRDVDGTLAALRRLADRQNLAGHVRFLGERRDIPAILSAADIHVSASHYEGFPNNILEAMCAGLPIVATAVGGVSEQIVHGSTGLLVPPGDPGALAAALLTLASDAKRRRMLGQAGRRRVEEQFPIQGAVRALELAYESAAQSIRNQARDRHVEDR